VLSNVLTKIAAPIGTGPKVKGYLFYLVSSAVPASGLWRFLAYDAFGRVGEYFWVTSLAVLTLSCVMYCVVARRIVQRSAPESPVLKLRLLWSWCIFRFMASAWGAFACWLGTYFLIYGRLEGIFNVVPMPVPFLIVYVIVKYFCFARSIRFLLDGTDKDTKRLGVASGVDGQ
jgi:hypothetical protein